MTRQELDDLFGWAYMCFWAYITGYMGYLWVFNFGALRDITQTIREYAFL